MKHTHEKEEEEEDSRVSHASSSRGKVAPFSFDRSRVAQATRARKLDISFSTVLAEWQLSYLCMCVGSSTGLLAMKQEASEKHRHDSPSPPLNNNNVNNNNNASQSASSMFSNQALAAAAAAASLSSMLTPQQLIAAQCQALLATGQFPVTLANPSLYGHQLFAGWAPPSASSPPLQQAVGPQAAKSAACNNNNVVVSNKKPTVAVASSHKKKLAKLNSASASVKCETSEPAASPPSSVSPESNKDSRDKVFTCGVCSRSFGYKHVLQNHERTHTGEKPFKCPECHKRFTRDHHLKTHMRLHTGEKPYHCSHCDRQFVQVANLRRHLRVHTGERPYQCQVCSAKFSDSNQLKAHLLIHKDEKPFKCEPCQMRFRRRHHLNHHKCTALPSSFVSAELVDNRHHEPAVSSSPTVLPLNLASLPEQTEPEDLSMSSSRHYNARPQSHSSGGGSPMSHSPNSDCNDDDEDDVDLSRASPSSLFALDAQRVR